MSLKEEVQLLRKTFEKASDDELVLTIYNRAPTASDHIAAKQELDARKERKQEERYKKIEDRLEELKSPHWTVLPNFWLTVISAVAAILAAYFAWLALKSPDSPRQPAVVVAPVSLPPPPLPSPLPLKP